MVRTDELYHHGVLGQKWGVRRYQNKDGTRTAAGKKHEEELSSGSASGNSKAIGKRKLTDAEKAKIIRATVAVAGAVAVTAAVAYVAHDHYTKEFCDQVISEGTVLTRVSSTDSTDIKDPFYATYQKRDSVMYTGDFALSKVLRGETPYKMQIKVTKDLNIPSAEKARDAFSTLYRSDPDFAKTMNELTRTAAKDAIGMGHNAKRVGMLLRAQNAIDRGDTSNKALYDAFNYGLVAHDKGGKLDQMHQKFYDKLKSQGYNAVADVNDQKYSNYNTKRPVIVFDLESVGETKVSKIDTGVMLKDVVKSNFVRNGAAIAGVGGLAAGAAALDYANDIENRGKAVNQKNTNPQKTKKKEA